MTEFNMCEVLSTAANLKPHARETAFLFSRRLVKELAADDFPPDQWDTLPDEAQEWVNRQIRATNESKQVDEVPGFEECYGSLTPRFRSAAPNGEAEGVQEAAEQQSEPEPLVDEDGEAETAEAKPAKAKRQYTPRGYKQRTSKEGKPSAILRMKEMLIEDGSLTPTQLMDKLTAEGYTVSQSTVISCKADFRATVSILQAKGLMNVQLI